MNGADADIGKRTEDVNRHAAHDTALYDPAVHDNQIVAVYDSAAQANAARDALRAAGVADSAIQVLDRTAGDAAGPSSAEDRNQGGFWGAVKSLFAPKDDVAAFNQAVGRGHAMLVLTPDARTDRHRAIQILEESGPIDFDAKVEEWRQAGYDQLPNAGTASPAVEDTGYRTGLVEERLRVGRREAAGSGRVRSYVAERPGDRHIRLEEERIGGSAQDTNPGATSRGSGFNPPRT